jgi:hypothetical protein
LKWCRRTTEKIAIELGYLGIKACPSTVSKLLKEMGFSLKVNRKSISHSTAPDRNTQFEYIAAQRELFTRKGRPTISIDTKKKELIGPFKNSGSKWAREPTNVNDHDFPSQAEGIAIPYGIYEPTLNRGKVFVGTTCDTPEFAVESIAKWWTHSHRDYEDPKKLLIIADGGGSNSSRARAWKAFLQTHLADKYGISVTVCHYPPGTSKWNPIEHRLFSEISKNWQGQPLDSHETVINYIRTTTTKGGLKVDAELVDKEYERGIKVSKEEFDSLSVTFHRSAKKYNYTIQPRQNVT